MSIVEHAHEDIRRLYDYWCSIAPDGRLPGRQQFEPMDIPDLLPNIWLIEVHREPLRFWRRLVGTRIEEFAGRSLTKGWVADSVDGARQSSVHKNLAEVVETGQPSWRRGKSLIKFEKDFSEIERLFLPLASDGETVDMILAITVFYSLSLPDGGDGFGELITETLPSAVYG